MIGWIIGTVIGVVFAIAIFIGLFGIIQDWLKKRKSLRGKKKE